MPDKVVIDPSMEAFGQCMLCPHLCGANRLAGSLGKCAAGAVLMVSRAAPHHWEEPPISGESGSGTIFLANCSLKCCYCQNHAISGRGAGKPSSVEEVAGMCLDLQAQGVMNINFVTPTHYAPLLRKSVGIARESGLDLPIVWNTSGYETVDAIRENTGTVDVYLTDFKYFDGRLAKELSGVGDYFDVAMSALDAMVDCTGSPAYDRFHGSSRLVRGVVVRHMLLPGHLEDSKRVVEAVHRRFGDVVSLSIMNQYTPVIAKNASLGVDAAVRALEKHPELACAADPDEYERLLDFADSIGVAEYFWQDGPTSDESFIPEFR